jgi:hypothetical protein
MLLAERSSRSTSQEQIGVTLDANLLLECPRGVVRADNDQLSPTVTA